MGILVVSIDFELRWGVLDKVYNNVNLYKDNLLSVHENVPWILDIFQKKGIEATWATVGALGCDNWEEFESVKPSILPTYKNEKMHYSNTYNQKIDPEGKLYFAPDLIRQIIATPGQELGTHTFGHIYATEPNVTYEELREDLETSHSFMKEKFSYSPTSFVYPRNQVIYAERLLQDEIIQCYRGNEDVSYFSAKNQRAKKILNRAKILLDAVNPFSSHTYTIDGIQNKNIKSSAMFRIYLSDTLRYMHLKKLKHNIKNLKKNEVYHIWFHPHNVGTSLKRKEDFMHFFDFVSEQIAEGKLQSLTMSKILEQVEN